MVAACREHLAETSTVALLGFPNHGNVGDSTIWLGQRALLALLDLDPPCYTASAESYSPEALRRCSSPETPILLSGGGNFGDLWPVAQEFRERVIRDFPDRRIVQLPQSVWFRREEARRRARRLFREHPRFTLLVRDERSRDRAQDGLGVPATLCPDVAFALGPLDLDVERDRSDILWLSRTDRESASDHDRTDLLELAASEGVDVERRDWRHDSPGLMLSLLSSAHPRIPAWPPVLRRWAEEELARRRTLRGIRMLEGARSVITDRLHGHILCVLTGVPHWILDNSYGKLSSFYRTWTSDLDSVGLASNPEAAMRRAVEEATAR